MHVPPGTTGPPGTTPSGAAVAAAVIAVGALTSVLGVALGSILRNQTTAIIVLLLWTLLAERFVFAALPPVLPFGGLLGAAALNRRGEHRFEPLTLLRQLCALVGGR